jgi:pyridoxine/pyridoxamine 5'-phosphate oxidase
MTHQDVFRFIAGKRLAVISTVSASFQPQAALIGFAFNPALGLVFDTSCKSRKVRNLRARPKSALVIGWDDETSVQLEGVAAEPTGDELRRAKEAYFATWPDGRARQSWPDIAYFLFKPAWMRYSQYADPPIIAEFNGPFA